MRIRCSFCGAEYEAPVTRVTLLLVHRCERCGREALRPVESDGAECRCAADNPRDERTA
jgi:DNA-directed RNA polymerase subunit RPC12/RpoP